MSSPLRNGEQVSSYQHVFIGAAFDPQVREANLGPVSCLRTSVSQGTGNNFLPLSQKDFSDMLLLILPQLPCLVAGARYSTDKKIGLPVFLMEKRLVCLVCLMAPAGTRSGP